jgi:hypothetical protein
MRSIRLRLPRLRETRASWSKYEHAKGAECRQGILLEFDVVLTILQFYAAE